MKRGAFGLILAWLVTGEAVGIAPAAGAELTARLEVVTPQPASESPYRTARLIVRNGLPTVIRAVSLRASDGGPTLLYPMMLVSGGDGRRQVELPATAAEQTYTIEAFDAYDEAPAPAPAPASRPAPALRGPAPGARPPAAGLPAEPHLLATTTATLSWPLELVDTRRILNPQALGAFATARAHWPAGLRYQLLILLLGLLVLSGFLTLLRRGWLQAVALLVLVAGCGALLEWMRRSGAPPPAQAATIEIVLRHAGGSDRLTSLTLLTGLRSAEGTVQVPVGWCVYPDRATMASDYTLLRPGGPGGPRQAAVTFRVSPAGMKLLVWRGLAGANVPVPPDIKLTPSAERAGEWIIQSDRDLPPAALVVGDRVTAVPPLRARTKATIPAENSAPLRQLRASPETFGLDAELLRAFAWWDQTERRADQLYLLVAGRPGDTRRLLITPVSPSPP